MSDPGVLATTLEQSGPAKAATARPSNQNAASFKAPLLTLEEPEAAKKLFELWKSQERTMRRRQQVWLANRLRRKGVTGVVLLKRQDTSEWIAYAPPGTAKQVPALNKADRQCRLLAATIFADPPEPEAMPSSDQDSDRDAAEFATRVLSDLGMEGQLDTMTTARQAFDLSSSFASTFRHYYIDPRGGGWQPLPIQASPQRTAPIQAPEDAITDPQTGESYPPPYVVKYLRIDGTLTDDRNDKLVQKAWMPRLKNRILTGHQVRPLPPSARDIWEAHGVVIADWIPLDDLRARFGDKIPADQETLKKWTSYKPEHAEDTFPGGKRALQTSTDLPLSGDTPVFVLMCYYKQTDSYPRGCYVVGVNGDTILHRQVWVDPQTEDPMDIPLDQCKQMDEEDDFYGRGMMQVLGPANEIRASTLGGMLEHQDRFLNRKTFVPLTSTYQAKSAQAMTATVIPINAGGEPHYEEIPDFPRALVEMFQLTSTEMEHESGLESPVTGESDPNVKSGLHARTIIEQVHLGLSDIQQNVVRFLTRGWRIQLQLTKAYYTIPQRIGWFGDDGAYKEKLWTGSDLGTTKDVRLHKGTLSMLSPSAKTAVAQEMYNLVDPQTGEHIIGVSELRRIIMGNVGGVFGLQDDPARQRVQRQITTWVDGPPKNWVAKPPSVDPATQQPIPAPDPALDGIWAPVMSDADPQTAKVRYEELTRLMNSTRYSRWPIGWRSGVDREWQRMKFAAGIQTADDQQQAALQQQQAAQAQADAQTQAQGQQVQQEQEAQAAQLQAKSDALAQHQEATQQTADAVQQAIAAVLEQTQRDTQAMLEQTRVMVESAAAQTMETIKALAQAVQPLPVAPPIIPPPAFNIEIPLTIVQDGKARTMTLTRDQVTGQVTGGTVVPE